MKLAMAVPRDKEVTLGSMRVMRVLEVIDCCRAYASLVSSITLNPGAISFMVTKTHQVDSVVAHSASPKVSDARREDASASKERLEIGGHVPALDGVRGLAIVMVLVVHFIGDTQPGTFFEEALTQVTSYGAMGVDLFFVLSGFLITGILFDSRKKSAYFKNFYMRRVLRIFPLYYAVLLLALVGIPQIVHIEELNKAVEHQAWLWTYSANIFVALKGSFEALPVFSHFWSLAVEEQFYLVWPLVVFFCDGPRLKRVSLIVAAGALVLRFSMILAGVNDVAVYALTPGRLDGLAMGALLSIVVRDDPRTYRLARIANLTFVISATFIVLSFVLTRWVPGARPSLHEIRQTAFAGCFCSILLYSMSGPRFVRRFFQSRTMTFFGKYSYGLYVFHFLYCYFLLRYRTEYVVARLVGSHTLAIFIQAAVGIGVAVLISLISYNLFEKHFLKLKSKF